MIADAIHSLSDVFTTIIVIIGVKISAKKADKDHPYGHERFECIAAMLLSFMLAAVGIVIGYSAITKLVSGAYKTAELPKTIALVAAIVSIVEQVVMFALTRHVANKINSGALKADAWHHLSDSLSSVGSFVGILGAMLGFPILDIIASLFICIIILKVAVDVFLDSVNKVTDKAVDEKTESEIFAVASKIDGVKNIDSLRTRQFGNMIYVEIEIACDGTLKLFDAHLVAHHVHDEIEGQFKLVKHCTVHVNPYADLTAESEKQL
jgi:cation diffusion facilitator family transporter